MWSYVGEEGRGVDAVKNQMYAYTIGNNCCNKTGKRKAISYGIPKVFSNSLVVYLGSNDDYAGFQKFIMWSENRGVMNNFLGLFKKELLSMKDL